MAPMNPQDFTGDETVAHAIDLALRAHDLGYDMGEWMAMVACGAGARLKDQAEDPRYASAIARFLANRPGSWEASHVRNLMIGTIGEDESGLGPYR